MKKLLLSFLLSIITINAYSQSIVVNNANDPQTALNAEELIQEVLVNGNSCVQISLTNLIENPDGIGNIPERSWGFFRNNGTDFPFEEGIILSSGFAVSAQGPNDQGGSSDGTFDWGGDPDIEAILNNFTGTNIETENATVFEFTFISALDQVDFEFIFASEEYEDQFECSDTFRDGFAFLISGPGIADTSGAPFGGQNIASIEGSNNIPINTLSIHSDDFLCDSETEGVDFFPELYVSNQGPNNTNSIQFDGRTIALNTATVDILPNEEYTVKLVISDRGDSAFDSAVFLNAGSFSAGATDLGDDLLVISGNAACEGDTVTLSAEDPDASTYTWSLNNSILTGETNPTLEVTQPGTYSVSVSLIGTECTIEDEILVEFITASDVNLGDDIEACEGDTVTIDTGILETSATFAWFLNNSILINQINPTLNVTQPGEYAVSVTFNSGCIFTDTIQVDFEEAPIIELGNTINSCLENPITLDATPSNTDPADATFAWTLDGVIIAGETNPTLDITQEGLYAVTVTSEPCVVTDFVTVNPLTILFELGDDFNTCFNEDIVLDATPTNIDATIATYEWSLNGVIITTETSSMLTITEPGTYDVTVTSGVCSDTDTITITMANPDGSECTEPEDCDIVGVDAGPDLEVDCENPCVDLNASVLAMPLTSTSTYRIEQTECVIPITGGTPTNLIDDDTWSDVIELPFTFTFYQNDYTSIIVGANGQISFDTSLTGEFNQWNTVVGQTIPNDDQLTFPLNTIYGAFHDLNPETNPDPDAINYFISGEAPFRAFVLNFNMVPQFSCIDLLTSQQIIIYETTNIVDVNIINKPVCEAWNDGLAVLGLIGNDNTEFSVPEDRNTGPWEAFNENWRFIPNGEASEDAVFTWTDEDGTILSNDLIFNVCPTETTTYTATITFTNTEGEEVTVSDDVTVTANVVDFTVDAGVDDVFCDVTSFEIVPVLTGDVTDPTYLWSTGETTETIVVTTSDIYTVEVTVGGCVMMDEVMITFLESPCTIDSDCLVIDFLEDFGTGTERVSTPFTQYVFNAGPGQVNDGEYAIINTSADLNIGWHDNLEDNTPGDVNGRALFVNADFNTDEFYRRTVDNLLTDTDYTFSSFITTAYDTDTNICPDNGIPANVTFRVEDLAGAILAEIDTGDIINEADPNWQEFTIDFNSAMNTSVQIVLVNNSIGGCGNDLAIDDISLSFSGDSPILATPMDLELCDDLGDMVEIFDLTSQIPSILDGLDPTDFVITFHTELLDAEANVMPIATPNAYTNISNPETIYIRVQRVTDENCFSTVAFDLILNDIFSLANNLPATIEICSTDSVPVLDATPLDPNIDLNAVTYEWSDSSNTVVSTNAQFTPTVSDTYTVVVELSSCNQETFTIDFNITQIPVLDLGTDELLCDNESFEIIPSISGDLTGATFLWSTGETTQTIIVDQSGTYDLTITLGSCTVNDAITITISDPVNVSLVDDFTTCREFPNTLTANSDDANVTFEWFLNGDLITGETSSTLDFSIPETAVGTQVYSVVVTNSQGCTNEDSVDVSLFDVGNCVISQGISPDDSPGFNDTLDLEFLAARSGIDNLKIYNRLGTLVYEQNDYVNQWRGQSDNNNDLPTGTYFYVISLETEDSVFGRQATGWIYINRAE